VTGQVRDERYHLAVTVDRAGAPWRIDLTLWLHDSHLNVTRWHEDLRERITPAQRIAVLRIKDVWHRRPAYPDQVGGLDIYTAVIEEACAPRASSPPGLPVTGCPTHSFLDALGSGGADALVDRECLPQGCDGLAGVAFFQVAVADSLQCACFLWGRADVAGDGQRLAVLVAGPACGRDAERELAEPVQRFGLAEPVAEVSEQG
jgi:hypothetical protein